MTAGVCMCRSAWSASPVCRYLTQASLLPSGVSSRMVRSLRVAGPEVGPVDLLEDLQHGDQFCSTSGQCTCTLDSQPPKLL